MTKNDWKYVVKRVITYIAIAMIMLLLGSCNVHALVDARDIGTRQVTFTTSRSGSTVLSNPEFVNYGYGYIVTSLQIYCGPNNNCANAGLESATITRSNDYYHYACEIGNNFAYNDSLTLNTTYTIKCPVDFTNNTGLYAIDFTITGSGTGNRYINMSRYITFVSQEGSEVANAINGNTQAVNNVNDTLNDDTPPSTSDISSSSSDWSSNNTDSGVINNLVLMPISLLNSVVTGLSGTCSTYNIGELWGENLTLPCINLSNILGAVWTIIDVIMSGVFIFVFGKRCVKIFNDFTNLRSGQIDSLYGGGE